MRMTTAERVTRTPAEEDALRRLVDGARMDQKTFHALYLLTPPGFKAELIGGVVSVASPVSARHAKPHALLVGWMIRYMESTDGVDVLDNGTTILGDKSEPQPDAFLLIHRACGGRTRFDDGGYVVGPPELVAEVAHTTAADDLGVKKADYLAGGVREYIVINTVASAVHWFVRRRGLYVELATGDDGVIRSVTFPGLWLDTAAFFGDKPRRLTAVLRQGLASPEHATFVAELKTRRAAKAKPKTKSKPKTRKPE